jgi:pentapeptide repeat protein
MSNGGGGAAWLAGFGRAVLGWLRWLGGRLLAGVTWTRNRLRGFGEASVFNRAYLLANLLLLVSVGVQIWLQKDSADRVWIAQQLSTIYDKECWTLSNDERACELKAGTRAREEAVKAYSKIADKVRLKDAELAWMAFEKVDFTEGDLANGQFQGTNFTKAHLSRANLVGAGLESAILAGADLRKADLTASTLQDANLSHANLEGAILEKVVIGACVPAGFDVGTGEQYVGAVSSAADCSDTRFRGAVLKEAKICGVDLSHAVGLEQGQLDSAIGSWLTKIPRYLRRPASWMKAPVGPPAPKEKNRTAAPPVPESSESH